MRPQTTDHRPQTTDHRPQTTDHRPQTTDHRPQTTDHRPQTTRPQTTESLTNYKSLWEHLKAPTNLLSVTISSPSVATTEDKPLVEPDDTDLKFRVMVDAGTDTASIKRSEKTTNFLKQVTLNTVVNFYKTKLLIEANTRRLLCF